MKAQQQPASSGQEGAPAPSFGVSQAAAMIVGIVVGAGIYRAPALVAGQSANETAMLGIWLLGGLLSIVGALCYAELASAHPHAGGEYHFLERAFGRKFAFLYGWARLAVIQTGSLALLAYVYGDYASQLLPLGQWSSAIHAAIAVLAVTGVNWAGVALGTRTQIWLTVVEIACLLTLCFVGTLVTQEAASSSVPKHHTALGLALVFVLLTYGGWNEAAYLSAELRGARHRLMPVLVGSIAVVTLLYVLANYAYARTLGLSGLAASDAPAADVLRLAWGEEGVALISLGVAAAALTSANATAFTGARSAYALGRDFPQLAYLGRWTSKEGTPRNALLVQGAAALLLVGLGAFARDGFELAVEYCAPAFWFFFLAVGVSLFVLRNSYPAARDTYRVPLYPFLPALFCLTNLYLLYSSLAYTGLGSLVGGAVVAIGALMLPFLKERRS